MPNERETGSRGGKNACLLAFLLAFVCPALSGCGAFLGVDIHREFGGDERKSKAEELPVAVQVFFRPLPERAPGGADDTPELVALGHRLYFERDLSLTKSQSCNDCHRLDVPDGAGVDHVATSKGAQGVSGKRNSPTVLNAAFEVAQFWDGRAPDLVEQAKGPLLNPGEMSMRTEAEVVARLESSGNWHASFARAFPGESFQINFQNVARAIAAFERTLITPARFDRYLKGETDALTAKEKQGLHRFMDTGCIDCHSSHPVGGRLFRKIGVYHDYANLEDLGRFGITHQEEDRLVFKVCALRNVTLTAPYFHDGRVSALPEAVRQMAWLQLDVALATAQIDEIVRFLRTLEAERPLVIARPP